MKTLILWWWMFGFAIARHLGIHNPEKYIYLYEKDETVFSHLQKTWESPYFFKGKTLTENILFEEDLDWNIGSYDLIIIAIPAQFVVSFLQTFQEKYKKWITFLNLSKWINNQTLETIGEGLHKKLWWMDYNYAVLSGGMVAQELVDNHILWADIAIENNSIWHKLQLLFESNTLNIHLSEIPTRNVELFGAMKNIIAIIIGYYIGKGLSYSSLWYYMCKLLEEKKALIELLHGSEHFYFHHYSLWWDLIATCFWDSRNRYLGELIWKWKSINEALEILQKEHKTSEWYHTLKWVYSLVKDSPWFEEIKKISTLIL